MYQEQWVRSDMYGRFRKKRNIWNPKNELEAELVTLLGGRAAEELKFDSITTGAANDIEKGNENCKSHDYDVWYVR